MSHKLDYRDMWALVACQTLDDHYHWYGILREVRDYNPLDWTVEEVREGGIKHLRGYVRLLRNTIRETATKHECTYGDVWNYFKQHIPNIYDHFSVHHRRD